MRELPWLVALRRLQAGEPGATGRFAQLATLSLDGLPTVRTVVVRGVVENGTLEMTTDSRSAKVAGIAACSFAELCWYFPTMREQLRLTGRASVITDPTNPRRLHHWRAMSVASRAPFFGPAPGALRTEGKEGASDAQQESNSVGDSTNGDDPPGPFALLVLQVDSVDHFALREMTRVLWRREGEEWISSEVNP